MAYIIPKGEHPQQSYTPAKYKGEDVMITTVPGVVVCMFLDVGETRYMMWDEVIACMAVATIEELPKPKPAEEPKPERKPVVREVQKSKPN
jgi:hypothetical protein